jgi:hypothetical protein
MTEVLVYLIESCFHFGVVESHCFERELHPDFFGVSWAVLVTNMGMSCTTTFTLFLWDVFVEWIVLVQILFSFLAIIHRYTHCMPITHICTFLVYFLNLFLLLF